MMPCKVVLWKWSCVSYSFAGFSSLSFTGSSLFLLYLKPYHSCCTERTCWIFAWLRSSPLWREDAFSKSLHFSLQQQLCPGFLCELHSATTRFPIQSIPFTWVAVAPKFAAWADFVVLLFLRCYDLSHWLDVSTISMLLQHFSNLIYSQRSFEDLFVCVQTLILYVCCEVSLVHCY